MVLATLLLLFAAPQGNDGAKVSAASSANSERQVLSARTSENFDSVSKDSTPAAVLPSAPEPKVKPEAEPAPLRSAAGQPFLAIRRRPVETPGQRKMWYGLMAVSHVGAAFDAWSTRWAISGGYGQEANPFLKPFANSNAIYAATQVSPAVMDYLGKRMMTSENPWIRKLWWFPQVAGSSMSFAAGVHNVGVVH
ncbi:MAG TPA: hypothetical protein VJN92_08165 [Candidatus Acidoferrum sp.]|nr:hypothetical protein [Candidatus Acidoferrum sp.]